MLGADQSVLHHTGIQECPDKLQQPLVFDAFRDLAHQLVMIDSIEELFQIEINHPSVALRDLLLRLRHGVMRRSTRSKPVAVSGKRRVPSPLQNLHYIRLFQLHLAETGASICNRNRIMTGLRFLFRVTLRRLDLAAEIYHIREPQKIPLVMSADETRRLLAVASSLKVRTLLSLGYGCGLRAGEVVRLKVKDIDRAQSIIRIEQSKGRKDRHLMLSPEMLLAATAAFTHPAA
jgi:integrase